MGGVDKASYPFVQDIAWGLGGHESQELVGWSVVVALTKKYCVLTFHDADGPLNGFEWEVNG